MTVRKRLRIKHVSIDIERQTQRPPGTSELFEVQPTGTGEKSDDKSGHNKLYKLQKKTELYY